MKLTNVSRYDAILMLSEEEVAVFNVVLMEARNSLIKERERIMSIDAGESEIRGDFLRMYIGEPLLFVNSMLGMIRKLKEEE